MSIQFRSLYLYSSNPQKLFHFLSFLFDVELDSEVDGEICLDFYGIELRLVSQESDKLQNERSKRISLSVSTQVELDELLKTLEFYAYKEGVKPLVSSYEDGCLRFRDFDQRQWEVRVWPISGSPL